MKSDSIFFTFVWVFSRLLSPRALCFLFRRINRFLLLSLSRHQILVVVPLGRPSKLRCPDVLSRGWFRKKREREKATVSWWLRAFWRYITYTRPSYGHQSCKCSSWPHVTKPSTSEQAFVTWTKGDLQVCKRKCHLWSFRRRNWFFFGLGIYVLDILFDKGTKFPLNPAPLQVLTKSPECPRT